MKKLGHLSEIYSFYDAFIIDLWGVMHDGVKIDPNANEVIQNLEIKSGGLDVKKLLIFLMNY